MQLEPITLTDPGSGTTAKIASGFGFNCYSFQPVVAGGPIEVLWSEADFLSGTSKPSHSGIPILFPFPGRLHGSHLTYHGQSYPLGTDDGLGNAIHGFVLSRPWRIIENLGHRAAGEFHASVDEPGLMRRWPSDFRISVVYEVTGSSLICEIEIHNPGQSRLPFGLGLHPYFRLPLGADGRAPDYRVTVPAAQYWELADMLPTGRRLPADGPRQLSSGLRFDQMRLDDVFTDLTFVDGVGQATIDNPHTGRRLELIFDQAFREHVVYNPPHREAVCLEPYTCVPNAYELEAEGVDTGLRQLNAGERFGTRFEIRIT
jgi:aldose 1-epimerase